MKRMKFFTLALGLCLLSSLAIAENPVHWTFNNLVLTDSGSASWNSGSSLIDDMPLYDYDFITTKIEIGTWVGLLGDYVWTDVTPDPAPTDSGQATGGLPTILVDDHMSQTQGSISIEADVIVGLDVTGQGYVNVNNITISGVDAVRMSGTVDVAGTVPEPCTMVILGAAGVAVLARKRRK